MRKCSWVYHALNAIYSLIKNYSRRNFYFVVLVANLYGITFGIFLPILCNGFIYSKYFFPGLSNDEIEKKVVHVNDRRVKAAEIYLDFKNKNESLDYYRSVQDLNMTDLTIAVVTVKRTSDHKLNYLTQVVTKLDFLIHSDLSMGRKAMFICNTEAGPGKHEEAERLSKYFLSKMRFPKSDPAASIMDKFEKEKEDYIYCLAKALEFKSKYIVIIEDDTVPTDNMLTVLQYLVESYMEKKTYHGDWITNSQQWAFLKLYYPERWQGYAFEFKRIIELFSFGTIGGSGFVFLYHLLSKSVQRCYLISFVLGAVYMILVVLLIGRQHIIQWKTWSKYTYDVIAAPDCCTPAILYERSMAERLIQHLNATVCDNNYPIDYAMDKFAKDNKYSKYLVEPNIFKHIGMFSSIKRKSKHPKNFWFY